MWNDVPTMSSTRKKIKSMMRRIVMRVEREMAMVIDNKKARKGVARTMGVRREGEEETEMR